MYTPASFSVTDRTQLQAFLRDHSFATLVTRAGTDFDATHIPLLFDPDRGALGCLRGHVARANPLWREADGQPVLAIFQGPHAYISPTWYATQNAVPTWNYVAVHATGRLRCLEDREDLHRLVRQTVDRYEAAFPQPWSLAGPDPEFVDRLLDGIVGFEIPIDRLEGKWKLNQNHPPERRERVIRTLREQPGAEAGAVADLMEQTLGPAP